jgi:histone H3/H4
VRGSSASAQPPKRKRSSAKKAFDAYLKGRRGGKRPDLFIPKLSVQRLVHGIAARCRSDLRFQQEAIDILQETAEGLLTRAERVLAERGITAGTVVATCTGSDCQTKCRSSSAGSRGRSATFTREVQQTFGGVSAPAADARTLRGQPGGPSQATMRTMRPAASSSAQSVTSAPFSRR